MRTRTLIATYAALLAALAVGTPLASAEPPELLGPFPVNQELLDNLRSSIESRCGVDVTDISGSGTIIYKHFYNGAEEDPMRGQGWFNFTIEVTTSTGASTTIREHSMDKYPYDGTDFSYESTSGRAVSGLGSIGHLDADGVLRGRTYDICTDLQ